MLKSGKFILKSSLLNRFLAGRNMIGPVSILLRKKRWGFAVTRGRSYCKLVNNAATEEIIVDAATFKNF